MTTTTLRRYPSIAAIKRQNVALGQTWFSPGAMTFFNTTIWSRAPIKGRFFVTGEVEDETFPLRYSVREARSDGSIETRGEFQGFATAGAAVEFAASLDPSDD